MGRRGPLGCGDLQSYYKRTAAIARHLEQESMWWRRKQGRDFLVLNSFYWLKDAVGKELLSALLKGPAIFTTSDRNYVDFLAINATVTLPLPLPLPLPLSLALALTLSLSLSLALTLTQVMPVFGYINGHSDIDLHELLARCKLQRRC